MSTLVFKTAEDAPYDVELSRVGVLPAGGVGYIAVEDAALVMQELQAKDDEGRIIDPDPTSGMGKPLSGKKLEEAAKVFAANRGLVVETLGERKLAEADQENPLRSHLLDELPSPIEASRAAYVEVFGESGDIEDLSPVGAAVEAAPPDEDEGGAKK